MKISFFFISFACLFSLFFLLLCIRFLMTFFFVVVVCSCEVVLTMYRSVGRTDDAGNTFIHYTDRQCKEMWRRNKKDREENIFIFNVLFLVILVVVFHLSSSASSLYGSFHSIDSTLSVLVFSPQLPCTDVEVL